MQCCGHGFESGPGSWLHVINSLSLLFLSTRLHGTPNLSLFGWISYSLIKYNYKFCSFVAVGLMDSLLKKSSSSSDAGGNVSQLRFGATKGFIQCFCCSTPANSVKVPLTALVTAPHIVKSGLLSLFLGSNNKTQPKTIMLC